MWCTPRRVQHSVPTHIDTLVLDNYGTTEASYIYLYGTILIVDTDSDEFTSLILLYM
jgi:hypothetical protein